MYKIVYTCIEYLEENHQDIAMVFSRGKLLGDFENPRCLSLDFL